MRDPEAFVEAWFSHASTWWAWNGLEVLSETEPQEAFRLVLALIERASSESRLAEVATSALTIVLTTAGDAIIPNLEREATTNRRLRFCVTYLFQDADDPDFPGALWQRLEAIQREAEREFSSGAEPVVPADPRP